ncbi:unnamed protein product [Rotaria sp. Silwood2]|nr:unnamed protein product [Rotaria sp. Silwood2]
MFQFDVLLDISVLPPNVMALRDEKFIDFVKIEAGDGVAALLDIQGINCKYIEDAKSFKSSKYNQSSSTTANSTSPATSNNSSEKCCPKLQIYQLVNIKNTLLIH